MDKLTKTNEIEQVKAELEPTLCKQCLEFFGDQTKENLCSKCFRYHLFYFKFFYYIIF